MLSKKNIAVILFNMGGPDSLKSVKGFLFNLFYDKQIIRLPNPIRFILAYLISYFRNSKAIGIYKLIGGKSPILEMTKLQAHALEKVLNSDGIANYKVFVCMRYSHPFTNEVVDQITHYNPNEVILLPLYPQYSTTTTLSSLKEWLSCINKSKNKFPTKIICCYYSNKNYIKSWCNLIIPEYNKAKDFGRPRLLFSAHSLPISIVKTGDPYPLQIENNVQLIIEALQIDNLDWRICYQSKVGPVKWLGPSTEHELLKADDDNVPVVLIPIAFVSEHSETLVELDIEYKELVSNSKYFRVPTPGINDYFIQCLKELCIEEHPKKCQMSKMCWQCIKCDYI